MTGSALNYVPVRSHVLLPSAGTGQGAAGWSKLVLGTAATAAAGSPADLPSLSSLPKADVSFAGGALWAACKAPAAPKISPLPSPPQHAGLRLADQTGAGRRAKRYNLRAPCHGSGEVPPACLV